MAERRGGAAPDTSRSSPTATGAGQGAGPPVGAGHRAGAENVRARLRDAAELGIRELTVYAFSTENWSRSPQEVEDLIDLIAEYIDRVTPELHARASDCASSASVESGCPPSLVQKMEWAEELTAANRRITFFVPFNYGGRAEILHAAQRFHGDDRGGVPALSVCAGHA